jgi:hypothetical protein
LSIRQIVEPKDRNNCNLMLFGRMYPALGRRALGAIRGLIFAGLTATRIDAIASPIAALLRSAPRPSRLKVSRNRQCAALIGFQGNLLR